MEYNSIITQDIYYEVYYAHSLIETCKYHGINPYDYLKHIFSEIQKCSSAEDFEMLLPYRFDPEI